jgi:hypothetical protein
MDIAFLLLLIEENNYNDLPRRFLVPKYYSSILYLAKKSLRLMNEEDNRVFRQVFRFDFSSFFLLEKRFASYYERARFRGTTENLRNQKYPWTSRGRPKRRYFSTREALLILLRFLATGPHQEDYAMMTSGTRSVLSETLRHSLHSLLVTLQNWSISRISFPKSNDYCLYLSDLAREYVFKKKDYLITANVIGLIDGSILNRERPNDDAWQKTNYNAKSNNIAAKILIVQLFDGNYAAAVLNYIGSGHDARLCSWLNLSHQMNHLDLSFIIAGDTAFGTSPRMIRPLSEDEYVGDTNEISSYTTASMILSSFRIASEWGIGSIQKTFQILKKSLPIDDLEFGWIVWEVCLRLSNARNRLLRIGQVGTVFRES